MSTASYPQVRPRALALSFADALLALVVLNALLTAAYHATGNALFSVAINAGAGLSVLLGMGAVAIFGGLTRKELLWAGALCLCLGCGVAFNYPAVSAVELIKFITPFVVYFAARTSKDWPRLFGPSMALLAALPLLFAATTTSKVDVSTAAFAYFPTRNVAAVYYTAILFACTVRSRRNFVPAQVIVAIAFQKIGILLATLAAIGFWSLRQPTARNLLIIAASAVVAMVAYVGGFLNRPLYVVSNMLRDVSLLGVGGVSALSFETLVGRHGTTDLSGYFRLIHWRNIVDIWAGRGPVAWLFGYGAGQTPFLANIRLVPHNDYLRALVETGLFSLVIFIALLGKALMNLHNAAARTMFTILLLYFFPENLLTSYASMALFFGFAGLSSRITGESVREIRAPHKRAAGPRQPRFQLPPRYSRQATSAMD